MEIGALDRDGFGTAQIGSRTARVLGALPGETITARHLRRRRKIDLFKTVEVQAPAAQRVAPLCEAFGRCGGCVLQHMDGAAQIALKEHALREALAQHDLQPARWLPPLLGPTRAYRYKARLGVRRVLKKDRVLVGFREFGTGWVTDTDHCPVLVDSVGERLRDLSDCIGSLDAAAQIPQIEVAAGEHETALILRHLEPLGDADLQRLREFSDQFDLRIFLQSGGAESVVPLLDGQTEMLSYELPEYDLQMHFRPNQFTQVNPAMNRLMLAQVIRELAPRPGDRILDLFCGLGNFSLPLARHCGSVTGVEGDAQLVAQATENAARNGITNAAFEESDLYRDYTGGHWSQGQYDRILLDPPRTGAEQIVAGLAAWAPRQVVYVSCNPATLVRDTAILVAQGFRLEAAGIMDMFPHTAHVESMAVFAAGD